MTKVFQFLNEVRNDEEGAALAEYAVLLGIITVAIVGVMATFTGVIHTKFTSICTALGGTC